MYRSNVISKLEIRIRHSDPGRRSSSGIWNDRKRMMIQNACFLPRTRESFVKLQGYLRETLHQETKSILLRKSVLNLHFLPVIPIA